VPDDFQRLLQEVSETNHQSALEGVVYLWGAETKVCDAANVPDMAAQLCAGALHLVQALAQANLTPQLWLVTQGGQIVDVATELSWPLATRDNSARGMKMAQGALWGLGRTIATEHPELRCTCVDLDDTNIDANVQSLLAELRLTEQIDQVAYRQRKRYVARLAHWQDQPSRDDDSTMESPVIQDNSSYLIPGGLGALGVQVAQQLVAEGARHLVLASRHGVTSEATRATIKQLEDAGATVSVVQADVASRDDVIQLLATCAKVAPLRGIVHLAGALDDGVLVQQSMERFAKVMAPKVWGTWHLHNLTQELPLDFFVCFSSMAAWLGSPGQGNYAAANGFMDMLMCQRRLQGLPGTSLNWGPWAEAGMAVQVEKRGLRPWKTQGITAISSKQGRRIFSELLSRNLTQVGILAVKWASFLRINRVPPSFFENVAKPVTTPQRSPEQVHGQLGKMASDERQGFLLTYLMSQLTHVIRLPEIDIQQPFILMGLDSLMAVELRNQIQRTLGVNVPVIKFLEDLSISSLANYIDEQLSNLSLSSYKIDPILNDDMATLQENGNRDAEQMAMHQTKMIEGTL
jgi:NAD(P)-dependent dehydrogenase (short-subunit alcohol dehydrogenase family)/acyl carrier protein